MSPPPFLPAICTYINYFPNLPGGASSFKVHLQCFCEVYFRQVYSSNCYSTRFLQVVQTYHLQLIQNTNTSFSYSSFSWVCLWTPSSYCFTSSCKGRAQAKPYSSTSATSFNKCSFCWFWHGQQHCFPPVPPSHLSFWSRLLVSDGGRRCCAFIPCQCTPKLDCSEHCYAAIPTFIPCGSSFPL